MLHLLPPELLTHILDLGVPSRSKVALECCCKTLRHVMTHAEGVYGALRMHAPWCQQLPRDEADAAADKISRWTVLRAKGVKQLHLRIDLALRYYRTSTCVSRTGVRVLSRCLPDVAEQCAAAGMQLFLAVHIPAQPVSLADSLFETFASAMPRLAGMLRGLRLVSGDQHILRVPLQALLGLVQLETLDISASFQHNAGLDTLDGISGLTALQHITLLGNKMLCKLAPDLFHLSRLKTLHIDVFNFPVLPSGLSTMQSLSRLELGRGPEGADGLTIENGASDGPTLAILTLSHVQVARATCISSPSLRRLSLGIIGKHDVQLGALPAVTYLSLRTHVIGGAHHFGHLPSLQEPIYHGHTYTGERLEQFRRRHAAEQASSAAPTG